VTILAIIGVIFTCLSILFILKACKKDEDSKEKVAGLGSEDESTHGMLVNQTNPNSITGESKTFE